MKFNSLKIILIPLVVILLFGCNNDEEQFYHDISNRISKIESGSKMSDFLKEVKTGKYEICDVQNKKCITDRTEKSIVYFSKDLFSQLRESTREDEIQFDNIYTREESKWSAGCVREIKDSPRLIKFVIKTENHLGIRYDKGGFFVRSYFELFKVKNEQVVGCWMNESKSDKIAELIDEIKKNE